MPTRKRKSVQKADGPAKRTRRAQVSNEVNSDSLPQEASIPDSVVDTIVQKVVAQVTRQLSTKRNHEDVDDVTEVDIGDGDVPPIDIAAGFVQNSADIVKTTITGENKEVLPTNMFTSPSLPIDARVSDKLQDKIWAHEQLSKRKKKKTKCLQGTYPLYNSC